MSEIEQNSGSGYGLRDIKYMIYQNEIKECKIVGISVDEDDENSYLFTVKIKNRVSDTSTNKLATNETLEGVKLSALFHSPEDLCDSLIKNIVKY